MKLVIKFIFILLIAIVPLAGETPHLMLYLDVNKTLIASDEAGGKSVEDVLNALLAEKFRFRWDASLRSPLSYDVYVKTVLLPGPNHDLELKKQRKALLTRFVESLREQEHPLYPEVFSIYQTALSKLQNGNGRVFPSFYHLVNYLDQTEISYTLILRSFGTEVYEIAAEINSHYPNKFQHSGKFDRGTLILGEWQAKSPREIYTLLRSLSHMAINDDWVYWNKGAQASQYAKPFLIDTSDNKTLGIFFDDNIDLSNSSKNIIAPIDVTTGRQIPVKDLPNQVVQVDTLEAILNDNYFIERVQKALLFAN